MSHGQFTSIRPIYVTGSRLKFWTRVASFGILLNVNDYTKTRSLILIEPRTLIRPYWRRPE